MTTSSDMRAQLGLAELAHRQKAAQLRANRIAAGPADLLEKLEDGRWVSAPHLAKLNEHLVQIVTKGKKRLVVSMPPRHGKSQLCSKGLPTWFLALFPDRQVLLASYEAGFAAKWGRAVRNLVAANEARLGFAISDDSTAADRWNTSIGGGMETSGVGGAMTGKGAHLLIVDDPVKNAEEADSEIIRERTWDWWTSTAYTRLEPDASVVLIMTRWHEDDLAGRVLQLAKETGDEWEVLEFPAIAEHHDALGRQPGEALWPARYPVDELASIERTVGPRVWNALYQQRPTSPAGALLLREWWGEYTAPRDRYDEILQSWDLTFKDTEGSDLVCGLVMGVRGSTIDLLDCDWRRMDFVTTLAAIKAMTKRWPLALAKLVEDKANGSAVISMLSGSIPGIIAVQPKGSKRARAAAVTPLLQAKNVRLPKGIAWAKALVEECAAFPTGRHDDGVDALTQGLNYLMHRSYRDSEAPPTFGSPEWERTQEERDERPQQMDPDDWGDGGGETW